MTPTEQKPSDALVVVTQADRDAAAKALWRDNQHRTSCKIRDGEIDNNWLVQAFARHRLAHSPVAPASGELVEAIRAAIPDVHILITDGYYDQAAQKLAEVALRARDAEVAAWLRERSNHRHPDWAFAAVFADAIEAGAIGRG